MNSLNPQEIKVALLVGGLSGEREISLASGESAQAALLEAGFQVIRLDPAEKQDLVRLIQEDFDVAFVCLHGKWGEDGTIQGLLEIIDLPYTGSSVLASALAMNKHQAKQAYIEQGLPTPYQVFLKKGDCFDAEQIVSKLGEHVVVKPATEGSALGVHIVKGAQEVEEAVKEVFTIDSSLLIENFIQGREFTCVVMGNDNPYALPVIEIIPKNEFYDFESKYSQGGSQHICPAELSSEQTEYIQSLALGAHTALGCEGVSRSDILLDHEGQGWILETNTIPGMTNTSLLPDAARVSGMSFPELTVELIKYAFDSYEHRVHGRK